MKHWNTAQYCTCCQLSHCQSCIFWCFSALKGFLQQLLKQKQTDSGGLESISTGCQNTNWSENKKKRHAITKHVQEKTQSLQVNKLWERRTHTTSLLSPFCQNIPLPYCLLNISVKTYHFLIVSQPFCQNIPLPDCLPNLSVKTYIFLTVSKPFCQNIPLPSCLQTFLSKHTTSLLSPNLSVETYHFLTVSKPFCRNIPLLYCLQTFLSKHTTSLLSPNLSVKINTQGS